MGEADEEKLLEDAIAAVDRLLEEVGRGDFNGEALLTTPSTSLQVAKWSSLPYDTHLSGKPGDGGDRPGRSPRSLGLHWPPSDLTSTTSQPDIYGGGGGGSGSDCAAQGPYGALRPTGQPPPQSQLLDPPSRPQPRPPLPGGAAGEHRRALHAAVLQLSHAHSQPEPAQHAEEHRRNANLLHPQPYSAPGDADADANGGQLPPAGAGDEPELPTALRAAAGAAAAAATAATDVTTPEAEPSLLTIGRFSGTGLSRAGAIRRRGTTLNFSVTREQDEALARAMDRARRMSDAVDGDVDLALALRGPSRRITGRRTSLQTSRGRATGLPLPLQIDRRGEDGGEGGGGATDGGGGGGGPAAGRSVHHALSRRYESRRASTHANVLANTELLNDLVDESLANRDGDFSPSASRGGGASNRALGVRHSETRIGGGIGGGAHIDKLATSGGGRLGTDQGLTLWTGNKSRVERARLAVRLLQATDLSRSKEDKQIDPYAVVSCEGQSYTSKAVMKSKDPFWDEFFVFDVPQPAFAELKVKVYDHLRCWRPVFMGQVRVPVKSIAEFPTRYSQPTWHQMRSRAGKNKGQVQMQLFYTAEWVHRALNVLACTWNVGNAEPPADLTPWLQGVQCLQHDLVAIGVQECLYKVGAGGVDVAAQEEEYGMLGDEGAAGYDMYGGQDSDNRGGDSRDPMDGTLGNMMYNSFTTNGHANRANGNGNGRKPDSQLDSGAALLDSLAQGATSGGENGGSGPPRPPRLSVLVPPTVPYPTATPGGTSPSGFTADTGGGDSGAQGTDGMSTPRSGMVTRESSTTALPTAAPSPVNHQPHRRAVPRNRTKSALMPSSMHLVASMAAGGGAGFMAGDPNGAPGQYGGPLPPPRTTNGMAARRRASVLEPSPGYRPGLNRIASVAVWPPPAGAGGGANDASFSSAVAGSGTSLHGFARPSVGHAAAASIGGGGVGGGGVSASGSGGAGLRGPGGAAGKGTQQTFKSKGVLTDMAKVGGEFRDLWEDRLKEAMGPGYFMAASAHMGQIRLLLFARNDVYAAISDVRTSKQATGVAGVATNKGGVGISLRVWETTIAFVNSHLAAHQDRTRARNNNYRDIIRGLKLDWQGSNMDVLTAFHHVVWMGDLNYRLDYGQQAITPTESPTAADFASLVAEVHQGAFAKLLEVDQLRREMSEKRAFLGFHEGPIHFEPSFKVLRRRGYDYNPQRSPAYCDRILYRSNLPLKQIRVLSYFSPPEIASSDHKPVAAALVVPTVWRTTVDEAHSSGRSQGLSSSLEAAGHLVMHRGLLSHPHHQPHAQVRLVFTLVRAHGLFMLRSRRRSAVTASAEFPSPQLLFSAPCMREAVVRSRVAPQTREPMWADADNPDLGPLVLDLKSAALAEMAHFRLWIRVLDMRGSERGPRLGGVSGGAAAAAGAAKGGRKAWKFGDAGGGGAAGNGGGGKGGGGGGGAGGGGSGSVLARGVLPLLDAVTMLLQDNNGVAPFNVLLELHGLPAGHLEGNMRVEVVGRAKTLERTHGSMRSGVYDMSDSLNNRASARRASGGSMQHGVRTSSRRSSAGMGATVDGSADGSGGAAGDVQPSGGSDAVSHGTHGAAAEGRGTTGGAGGGAAAGAHAVGTGGTGGGGGGGGFFASLRRSFAPATAATVTPQQLPLRPPQPLFDASAI